MKVGFLTSDLTRGHGWGSYTLNLLYALKQLGIEPTIVTTYNSPDMPNLPAAKLLPNVAPRAQYFFAKQFRNSVTIGRLLRDCALVHTTIEPFAPIGAWVAAGRPFVATAHGSYVDLLPNRRWPAGNIYRWALRRGQLICVSSYTARVARATLGDINPVVILNGIDPERFANLPSDKVQKQGPTVLSVGAVKLRKGTLELVRAMAQVRQTLPEARCVIIGSLDTAPGYVEQIKAEISLLGLDNHVHLLGHVPEATLLAWYGAADVFALPSMNVGRKFEGYGLTYMEASAAGLPVIGTTDCGAEDAIVDGKTGLLVSQSDVTAALPAAIMSLLENPEWAAQMGAAGRDHAQGQTWDRAAQKVIALYERVLSR